MNNYYMLEATYGVQGAVRICQMAENYLNQFRFLSQEDATLWAIEKYKQQLAEGLV